MNLFNIKYKRLSYQNFAAAAYFRGLPCAFLFLVVCLSGCDSRFVESKPNEVEVQPISMSNRLKSKEETDKRIDEIQGILQKIKSFISLVKKYQKSDLTDTNTTIDLIINLNQDLQQIIPVSEMNQSIRDGKIDLTKLIPNSPCKQMDIRLSSEVSSDASEKISYFVKGCNSDSDFIQIMNVEWRKEALSFEVLSQGVEKLIHEIDGRLQSSFQISPFGCISANDSRGVLESLECHDVKFGISKTEELDIKTLLFKTKGDVRLEIRSEIKEADLIKAEYSLIRYENGEIKSNLLKISDPKTSSTAK